MNTQKINELLNEAKEKSGIKTDLELANEIGIAKSAISKYRSGMVSPEIYAIARIAEMTKRPVLEVAAMIESESEKNDKKREYWANFCQKIMENKLILAGIILGLMIAGRDSGLFILC